MADDLFAEIMVVAVHRGQKEWLERRAKHFGLSPAAIIRMLIDRERDRLASVEASKKK